MNERLTNWMKTVYEDETLGKIFKTVSYASVFLSGYTLFYMLCGMLEAKDYWGTLELALSLGAAFLLVTLGRACVNAPRPYETLDFYEKKPKSRAGKSFPSRHAFCAFIIGTVACAVVPALGMITLAVGALMAISRVLLGYHYPRDVIAGALMGVLGGVAYILIF